MELIENIIFCILGVFAIAYLIGFALFIGVIVAIAKEYRN